MEASVSPTPSAAQLWMQRLAAHWATFPVLLFVFGRLAFLGISSVSMRMMPSLMYYGGLPRNEVVAQYPSLDGLFRWDTGFFEAIAKDGYTDLLQANFWPLYPLLVRGVSAVTTLHPHLSLLLVANVASLLSYLVLYRLFELLSDANAARWGLIAFAAYPFAFFQAAAYPESLTILFTSLAVLLALRQRHVGAGAALALGVLSRHTAIFTGTALLWAHLREKGWRGLLRPQALGLFIPLLAVAGFAYYLGQRFGDPLAFIHVREKWENSFLSVWPIMKNPAGTPHYASAAVFSLVPLAGTVALLWHRPWRILAPTAVLWLAVLYGFGAIGLGRHAASCWPAFLPVGALLARRPMLQGPLLLALASFQGLYLFLFSHHFHIY